MAELQKVPARHGVATFVPAGQVIKIINPSGTQVVDTWAFALPAPESKKTDDQADVEAKLDQPGQRKHGKLTPKTQSKKGKKTDLPSQEEAEETTKAAMIQSEESNVTRSNAKTQRTTWGSYVPSVPSLGLGKKKDSEQDEEGKDESEQQRNSRTWASYFPSGKGFTSYIPKSATDTVSAFSSLHQRDINKSYMQQLQDFSKTPVGAAGMAAVTGSTYSGSIYAGYQAWNAAHAKDAPAMEFMSMPHSRAATLHLRPKVNDTLVTNLREPILTLVEDTSPGIHDTLIAACDPQRYKGLGVPKWEEHGSCAENLVLALKEINQRAGLKGAKGVGADVTVNNVPAPLNLFMNIPWDDEGDIGFKGPKSKKGNFVRFKAERDVVVVMSACPQDILDINAKNPTDAEFIVEDGEEPARALKRTQTKKRPPPRKISSTSKLQSNLENSDKAKSATSQVGRKKPVPPAVQPQRKSVASQSTTSAQSVNKSTAASDAARSTRGASSGQNSAARPLKRSVAQEGSAPSPVAGNEAEDASGAVERKKPRKLRAGSKAAATRS